MKPFTIIIISLLFLLIPLTSLGLSLMDDLFFEATEPEIILRAGSLKLYWSADTYVPFGYRGRKLPATGSKITINAHLEISGVNPKNLYHSWFLDGIFQEIKSGYGQNGFQFWAGKFGGDSHTILLKAFNESRSFLVEKSITIPMVNPELIIYSKKGSRIYLPYAIAIKDFELFADKETSFLALPYFFDIKTLLDLEFNWIFANKTYKESSLTANIFGLKIINKKAEGSLEQALKVIATNMRRPDQRAEKAVRINIY